jgi:hypothetical protein
MLALLPTMIMPGRAVHRVVVVLAAFWLTANVGIAGQSRQQKPDPARPVIGVYFDEPLKLLEPFSKDFQRSCTCVERAFALVPRVVNDNPGPAASLRPGDAVLRVIRDAADAQWFETGNTPPRPRMLITGRGSHPSTEKLRSRLGYVHTESWLPAGILPHKRSLDTCTPSGSASNAVMNGPRIGMARPLSGTGPRQNWRWPPFTPSDAECPRTIKRPPIG